MMRAAPPELSRRDRRIMALVILAPALVVLAGGAAVVGFIVSAVGIALGWF